MFGQNYRAKAEQRMDGALRIVDGRPWYTIQGEGPYAGKPAVFLRLHGCPLTCHFCDTEFSKDSDPYVPLFDIVKMIEETAPEHCRLLVITGGEPTRQDLSRLVFQLTMEGWTVQIETAGVFWQDCLLDCVVVCSPKTPIIHPRIHQYAQAFKYVIEAGHASAEDGLPVTNTQDSQGTPKPLARPRPGAEVYLSPMDTGDAELNADNAAEVARLAMLYGYRAGLQLHKFMRVL